MSAEIVEIRAILAELVASVRHITNAIGIQQMMVDSLKQRIEALERR